MCHINCKFIAWTLRSLRAADIALTQTDCKHCAPLSATKRGRHKEQAKRLGLRLQQRMWLRLWQRLRLRAKFGFAKLQKLNQVVAKQATIATITTRTPTQETRHPRTMVKFSIWLYLFYSIAEIIFFLFYVTAKVWSSQKKKRLYEVKV